MSNNRQKKRITGQKRRDFSLRKSRILYHETGGKIRQSASGIWHVLFKIGDVTYSAYCFVDTGDWRVYWPYPGYPQEKKTFKSQRALIRHIRRLRAECW